DRIIGGTTPEAAELNRELYASFCSGDLLLTDAKTAEMAKLTENAFRDVNIAFANELSIIADRQGIDVWELIELANHHPRVNILQPGPGVGGHCIAVDPWFIVSAEREHSNLIRTAREVNDSKQSSCSRRCSRRRTSSRAPWSLRRASPARRTWALGVRPPAATSPGHWPRSSPTAPCWSWSPMSMSSPRSWRRRPTSSSPSSTRPWIAPTSCC